MAINAEKMHSERHWTQEKIDGLKQEGKRIHFDHFKGMEPIDGIEWYVWSDGSLHRFKESRKTARVTRR